VEGSLRAKNQLDYFSGFGFDTIPAWDGQTDRQTDTWHDSIASRDNKQQRKGYTCRTFRGLRVCLLGTPVSPAKTAEPIEMPLGSRLAWVHVLDGGAPWRHLTNMIERSAYYLIYFITGESVCVWFTVPYARPQSSTDLNRIWCVVTLCPSGGQFNFASLLCRWSSTSWGM